MASKRRSSKSTPEAKTSGAPPRTMLVRLKPLDKRRGFVIRSYTFAGTRFVVSRGWYEVGTALAEQLSRLRQVESDPHSPPAFDVATFEEAKRIDELEALGTERRDATDPDKTLVSGDTGSGRRARVAEQRARAAESEAAEKDRRIKELEAQLRDAAIRDAATGESVAEDGDGDGDGEIETDPPPEESPADEPAPPDPFEE